MTNQTAGLLSGAELGELLDASPPPEMFGPGSRYPALAFQLEGAEARFADMLATLVCPVIGIGEGSLAAACDIVLESPVRLATLMAQIARAPIAAMVLVQHLRASETLGLMAGLSAESMAYATVQMGPEFRSWQERRPVMQVFKEEGPPLLIEHQDDGLHIMMNRPLSLNAIGVEMRDALCEAFNLAALDPDTHRIVLSGNGRSFSVGGDVREFGQASDPATAHWIRSVRLPARHMVAIADQLVVKVNGAAVGAGTEIAAFAHRVVATSNAWFQLPEINYGLIPGAGGTISVPRRIGRQRAAEMMLSARRIPASVALEWGLIDAIED